jgi:ribosomal protein S18 acetylase RimI-like enzyme
MNQGTPIRRATSADAAAIGRIHVDCLRETYTGLMPPEWLAARTVEERTSRWKDILDDPEVFDTIAVCIAECGDGVCGFASCGSQRTEFLRERGYAGEISAIYILRRFQRRGIGLELMSGLASALQENGIETAALWCLRDNVGARHFYERIGGEFLLEQEGSDAHANQIEVAYGWRDLARLNTLHLPPSNGGA